MHLLKLSTLFGVFFLLLSCNPKPTETPTELPQTIDRNLLEQRLATISQKAIQDLKKLPFDSLQIPRSLKEDGALDARKSKQWTSGFYPGILWQLAGLDNNPDLVNGATQWIQPIEKEKLDSGTHDLGFKIYCSFGNAYQVTQKEEYKDIFITAAQTLSTRYNPTVGAIRSWDHNRDKWDFPVIIDNMMNLELLFEVAELTDDSTIWNIAEQHARTTLKNHFRADNSSYHVIDYNPETGAVRKRNTHQGASHESAWSRGQAWGLYGFTVVYRYTKDPVFLAKAEEIADYIFNHPNLPEDLIPYWDYDAPNIPDEPRDVSAATVTASGLIELSQYNPEKAPTYLAWADQILLSLEKDTYQTTAVPFFLKHSVGSVPGGSEVDVPIIYADYYYVEALKRRLASL
ncbi:MAG: glycoside hydrolase family 88 protein [Saprospiraceae bacterium]